ncbi:MULTISPECIES: D-alanine--D-alanine ligase family protein [unclassified Luteococcus]|uniref:D-alanine--D-alanine ligase family protein n=1 Tax=unclassified Luteococcus TaxID=2639923 RepID=UPI00313B8106
MSDPVTDERPTQEAQTPVAEQVDGAPQDKGAEQALAPVVVLAGGLSHERDVSLRSGRRVAQALRRAGHRVIESDINSDLVGLLRGLDRPVVVPMLHGGLGEDGAVREVLQLLGVPFVGCSGAACRTTFDKSVAGTVVGRYGWKAPEQVALPHDIFRELGADALVDALGERLGFPLIVKPARSGSALGTTKVNSMDELRVALVAAYAYGPVAVVEEFVAGTEVAVTILVGKERTRVLPAVEIRPESGIYDYDARYTAGFTRFLVPAELDESAAAKADALARGVVEALHLDGVVRVDMIVDDNGEPWFLEANTAPGMTETSLAPLAMEAAELDLGKLYSTLVQEAAER